MLGFHLSYELSKEADKDLEDIFDYTVDRFGFTQAVVYVNNFEDVFCHLTENPQLGRKRDEIKSGLRSFVKESHIVFYRILKDRIRIVRVLHASRDPIRFIPPAD